MKKFISLILTGSLLMTLLSLPLQSVSAQSKGNHSNTEMTNSIPSDATDMSTSTQEIADSHIVVENKKFIIENEEKLKNKVGKEQFQEVVKQIEYTNEQLSQIDLSNATVDEDKSTVKVNADFKQTSDGPQMLASVEGKDDIEFHWTYATVWLSKTTAEKTIKVGSGALGTAIGGIGGKLASAVAGSVIGGSISEFFAGSIAKAVKFNIALVPPFHTWNIQEQ